jgi:hypothetical protein
MELRRCYCGGLSASSEEQGDGNCCEDENDEGVAPETSHRWAVLGSCTAWDTVHMLKLGESACLVGVGLASHKQSVHNLPQFA